MPLILAGDRLILFAHVPKAGGSSVETYLQARFGKLMLRDQSWLNVKSGRHSLTASPQHLDGSDLARMFPEETVALKFAVVREPTARIISEFKYQSWPKHVRAVRRKRFAQLGFSVWLAMALAAARRYPVFLDNHLRPQTGMIPPGTEIFRLEDGFADLIARLDAVTETEAPDLEVGHELRGPGPARPLRPSRQDLALIVAAYAEDFDRLGYDRPDLTPAPHDPLAWARHTFGRMLAPVAVWLYRTGWM